MKLYCVLYKENIIGRFRTKEKAIDFLCDCWFDGWSDGYKIKTFTEEEYLDYTKKLIDKNKKF